MGVLLRELTELYGAYATGETPTLAPLPVQYADFALWQRSWLTGEVLTNQSAYWRRELAEVLTDERKRLIAAGGGTPTDPDRFVMLSRELAALCERKLGEKKPGKKSA